MPKPFQQLVFSGGGTRCFWQGGFLDVVKDQLGLEPGRISGVSGGAFAACCYVAGRGHEALEVMGDAFEQLEHNYSDRLLEGELTPHQRVYRDVVAEVLDDDAHRKIADGPPLQIALSRPAGMLPRKLASVLAIALYELDQHIRSSPHMRWAAAAGTRQLMVDARQAARDRLLVDLICAAAVIPPIFDIPKWPPGPDGVDVLDGGTYDNAPMPQPDRGNTLILLTRRYRHLPSMPARTYVQPSADVPADKIDFTSREKIEKTWDMGLEDGRRFLAESMSLQAA